jgi:hypothetical protein
VFCLKLCAILAFACWGNPSAWLVRSTSQDGPIPAGWKCIDLEPVTFYVPPGIKGGRAGGVDTEAWSFNGKGLKLKVSYGPYGLELDPYRRRSSYSETCVDIDGKPALIVHYEYDADELRDNPGVKKYVSLALFGANQPSATKTTIYVNYADSSEREIAIAIFRTIRVK